MMKNIAAIAVVAVMGLATAACSENEKRYAGWGGGGAAAGALAGQALGHDSKSTMLGAAIGGIGGSLVAHHKNKKAKNGSDLCTFRDPNGRLYDAPCSN